MVAGVSKMRYRTFVTYNVVGGVLWGVGRDPARRAGWAASPFVADHVEPIILFIVFLSVLPIASEVLLARREKRAGPAPRVDPLPTRDGD